MGLFLQEHHSSNIFLMQIMLITRERKALCIPPWLQLLSELDKTCLGCTGVEGIKKKHSPPPPKVERLQMQDYAQDKATQHPITEIANGLNFSLSYQSKEIHTDPFSLQSCKKR